MTENQLEILKLTITIGGSIGGYELLSKLIGKWYKKVKKKTPEELFDSYNKRLKVFIETHEDTLNKLNEALDEVTELKVLLREKDTKLKTLITQVETLTTQIKEKDTLINTIQTQQMESDILLNELKGLVEKFLCTNSCENRNQLKNIKK